MLDAKTLAEALWALIREREARGMDTYELRVQYEAAEDQRLREHFDHVHQTRLDNDTYDLY